MIDPLELHAYADGELAKSDEIRVRRALEHDSDSQAELDSILALKRCLSDRVPSVECKAEWSACQDRLQELRKTHRTEAFVGKYAWAICGAFFVFLIVGGVINRVFPGADMQSADLARAVASLSPASAPVSQDRRVVERYLDELVGRAAESISPERMQLTGAATGAVDGRRVVRLTMRDGSGDLALLVVNGLLDLSNLTESAEPGFRQGRVQGVNCVAWTADDNTLVLLADRSHGDLIEVAKTKLVR